MSLQTRPKPSGERAAIVVDNDDLADFLAAIEAEIETNQFNERKTLSHDRNNHAINAA
jgi:hypothetical protein